MLVNDYPRLFRQAVAYIIGVCLLWWFIFASLEGIGAS